ncbi:unnamed protein product [Arctia plantaginis]|uniref:Secreted protein n=1 Tax=Arctia plantaginis TaxID=874455 RepID=A0A8S1BC43_ARCPL|nr:unnamed protein product [Arctia plantaginis]
MQLFRSTVFLVLIHLSSDVVAVSLLDTLEFMEGALDKILLFADGVDGNGNPAVTTGVGRTRFKRQEPSKYVQTSKLPQLKLLRIHLQMLRNFFLIKKNIGGRHAMSHSVPKPTVTLFKIHIFDFLFPEIGIDAPPDRSRLI